MKCVILAGGLGTRLSEETALKPKPMVEIGGKPILWHIMKHYSHYGVNDFVICLGYRGHVIKEYFANFALHNHDVSFDFSLDPLPCYPFYLTRSIEPWRVTLIDTGENTQTGGRLKRVASFLQSEPYFHLTYGDGLADVDIRTLTEAHLRNGKLATVTAAQPPSRWGHLEIPEVGISQNYFEVTGFQEKPAHDDSSVNGGFFVLSPKVIDYIVGDETVFEEYPLQKLTSLGQFGAYEHRGFWHAMDTQRDKLALEALWASGKAPWKTW